MTVYIFLEIKLHNKHEKQTIQDFKIEVTFEAIYHKYKCINLILVKRKNNYIYIK